MMKLHKICKCYGEKQVLSIPEMQLADSGIYIIMGPSGGGKTTLLRLLCGLEQPTSGSIVGNQLKYSMVFQEDRLIKEGNGIDNIRIACPKLASCKASELAERAKGILSIEELEKPVQQMSGGMRRRVAILRAVLAGSDVILMDEPFKGLDADTKKCTAELIEKERRKRMLLVTTHNEDELALFPTAYGRIEVENGLCKLR